MGLAVWINSVGGKACYTESNQSGCLAALARAYEMEQTEIGFTFDGMKYLNGESVTPCNFIIHDIGRDYAENVRLIESADIILMCCGVKPYEMQYTIRLLRQFEAKHGFVVCPFVDDSLKESYAPVLQEMAGVGTTHISHIETGNTIPSLKTFIAIINALNLSADELFREHISKAKHVFEGEIAEILKDCYDEEMRLAADMVKALITSLHQRSGK